MDLDPPAKSKGKMVSLARADRTLFFDFLP